MIRIPGHSVVRQVGAGGMSRVFLARGERGDVAIKILKKQKAARPQTVENFKREADLMARFEHPNLVKGFGYGAVEPDVHYMTMEFMDGETLYEKIKRDSRLPEEFALKAVLDVGRAVAYLAEQRIVHRDIKPGNMMDNSHGEVKLLDVGFAIPMGEEAAKYESAGHTSGTAHYMSPEQVQAQTTELDVRADIYSLGASLYHMVVGQVPFPGKSSQEIRKKQLDEALSPETLKGRTISSHIHYFIERMMSKDKELRYETAGEMIQDIEEKAEGFASLDFKPESVPPPLQKPPTRRSATDRFRPKP